MRFTGYSFGSIRVDGVTYDHDLVIDRGKIRKRTLRSIGRARSISTTVDWSFRRFAWAASLLVPGQAATC